jgi:hypothetical protein
LIVAGGTPNLEKVSRIYSGVMTTLQVGDKVLDASIESTGKTSENSPYQTGVTAIDNTRVDVIELLQPVPYNCQSTQSFEVY